MCKLHHNKILNMNRYFIYWTNAWMIKYLIFWLPQYIFCILIKPIFYWNWSARFLWLTTYFEVKSSNMLNINKTWHLVCVENHTFGQCRIRISLFDFVFRFFLLKVERSCANLTLKCLLHFAQKKYLWIKKLKMFREMVFLKTILFFF